MRSIVHCIKMMLIIVLPNHLKGKIGVAFMYQLSDWQITLVALRFYHQLHKQAQLRLRGCVKERANGDFFMNVLAYRLGLYQGDDKESHEYRLVEKAVTLEAIAEVLEHVNLSQEQERLLLDRLWKLIEEPRTVFDSYYRELFIERSKKFKQLHSQRETLLAQQQDTALSLVFDNHLYN